MLFEKILSPAVVKLLMLPLLLLFSTLQANKESVIAVSASLCGKKLQISSFNYAIFRKRCIC
jgi:hypothetical protein